MKLSLLCAAMSTAILVSCSSGPTVGHLKGVDEGEVERGERLLLEAWTYTPLTVDELLEGRRVAHKESLLTVDQAGAAQISPELAGRERDAVSVNLPAHLFEALKSGQFTHDSFESEMRKATLGATIVIVRYVGQHGLTTIGIAWNNFYKACTEFDDAWPENDLRRALFAICSCT